MKKLKLELDDLQVTTFATEETGGERGTVQGHATREYTCVGDVCYKPTYQQSCIVWMTGCTVCNCPSVDACPTAFESCIVWMTGCGCTDDCSGTIDCQVEPVKTEVR